MTLLPALAGLALAAATVPAATGPAAPAPATPAPAAPAPATPAAAAPTAARSRPAPEPAATLPTPNAERTVIIGALNKRTGQTQLFEGHPGQAFVFGTLSVSVRTCETTPPWEQKLTGAFLLIDDRPLRAPARRVYSGWMFAESPSLHPLEHPLYDIWVKSCAMRFPETGPDTVSAGASPRSSPKKSADVPSAADSKPR